jgi:DNA-binding PadR family transcriptional regulator
MIIAAVLHLGDEAYGAAIIEEIAERTGREVSSGALSITLDRMEKKGIVSSLLRDEKEERGGRRRRYILVTAKGLALARESRWALLDCWRGIEEAYGKR